MAEAVIGPTPGMRIGVEPGVLLDQFHQSVDPSIQAVQLMAHYTENTICDLGHFQLLFGAVFPGEFGQSLDTRRQDMSKFPEDTADHVDDLGALPNDQIPGAVYGKHSLLVFRFDLDKPHRRPTHRFADRFGISRVRLAALHIEFDIGGRHQPHIMPELAQLTAQ